MSFRTRAAVATLIGLAVLALAVAGVFGAPVLSYSYPWFLLVGLFIFLPGAIALYRGEGSPSTYEIPRPKPRKAVSKQ